MSAAAPDALALNERLFATLNAREVAYCHWKSTPSLAVALAGRTDLDLLVGRSDADDFARVVRELGFKPFVSHESRRFPGVEDYLGYDVPSGRLVHLHVYHQLVLGEHHVKNHHLPIEDALLERTELRLGVRVPPPELELAILATRILLKYRDADALKDALRLGSRGGIPRDAREELRVLAGETDAERLRAAIERDLPFLPPEIVTRLVEIVERDPRDARALVGLRREIRRALRPYQRYPAHRAFLRYAAARLPRSWPISLVARSLTRREARRKSPASGGLTVAVVGADGAGKTTVVSELATWLGWRLHLRVLYLGSARPSPGTRLLKAVARAARAVDRRSAAGDERSRLARATHPLSTTLLALRYLADARDRAARANEGRRLAARGAVVLFDRYPLPSVLVDGHPMDGPRIPGLISTSAPAWLRHLAALEAATYERLPRPDHLFVLSVAPHVARSRKPDHAVGAVEAKSEALASLGSDGLEGLDLVEIDANQPLERVVADVKRCLWERL